MAVIGLPASFYFSPKSSPYGMSGLMLVSAGLIGSLWMLFGPERLGLLTIESYSGMSFFLKLIEVGSGEVVRTVYVCGGQPLCVGAPVGTYV